MDTLSAISAECCSHHEVVPGIIGNAPAVRKVLSRLPMLAHAEGAVLIAGETGTGKELLARAIHGLSRRASHPFVAVNCGSLLDTLFESELFGHERGAFTDAHTRRQGLVAQAAGGTLFLDETDALTPRAQIALLRVLQDRTFRPLGSSTEQRVDVRFLAATNARLESLVQSGAFRADLYYRLCVFSVCMPPLRERLEDILPLAEYFIGKGSPAYGPAPRLDTAAAAALLAYAWPGNVRELENAIERALAVAEGGRIETADLSLPEMPDEAGPGAPSGASRSYKLEKRRILDAFDRQYLRRLMTDHRGNVSRAAQEAGKERRDLGKLLKRHGFDPREFAVERIGLPSHAGPAVTW
jgi:two-component system, NtrC family, response regulator GlrR